MAKYNDNTYELVKQKIDATECQGCAFENDEEGCWAVNDGECLISPFTVWKETK